MGKLLVPLILGLIGLGGGIGAGIKFRPPPEVVEMNPCGDVSHDVAMDHNNSDEPTVLDYVKLSNQFVVPVVHDGKVASLVVLSLSLEVGTGGQEIIYEREPKLRDAFLQVLFDHANSGGFDGAFTNGHKMTILRNALKITATQILGAVSSDVLIVDLVRQDV